MSIVQFGFLDICRDLSTTGVQNPFTVMSIDGSLCPVPGFEISKAITGVEAIVGHGGVHKLVFKVFVVDAKLLGFIGRKDAFFVATIFVAFFNRLGHAFVAHAGIAGIAGGRNFGGFAFAALDCKCAVAIRIGNFANRIVRAGRVEHFVDDLRRWE